jgi:hypothetical protein
MAARIEFTVSLSPDEVEVLYRNLSARAIDEVEADTDRLCLSVNRREGLIVQLALIELVASIRAAIQEDNPNA